MSQYGSSRTAGIYFSGTAGASGRRADSRSRGFDQFGLEGEERTIKRQVPV